MKPLIVANWKCNPTTLKEARFLFDSIKRGIKKIKNVKVVICPPFPYLSLLSSQNYITLYSSISFGAQDCFWQEKGAFTGEVSPAMLKDLGVEYVILGHSERRRYFGETDEMINKKLKAALKVNLKPILCIGETDKERKERKTTKVLRNQLTSALKNLPEARPREKPWEKVIIAYEPVWAIGTGNPCQPEEAKKVLLFLRKILKNNQILYGGSVNSQNARDYILKAGFNGLLVGGASLDAQEFIKIVKISL